MAMGQSVLYMLRLERASGWLGAFSRRSRSAVVCGREAGHGAPLHGGSSGAGAAGLRAWRAEPVADRGPVRRGREHGVPLAANVAGGKAAPAQAARVRP